MCYIILLYNIFDLLYCWSLKYANRVNYNCKLFSLPNLASKISFKNLYFEYGKHCFLTNFIRKRTRRFWKTKDINI